MRQGFWCFRVYSFWRKDCRWSWWEGRVIGGSGEEGEMGFLMCGLGLFVGWFGGKGALVE